MLQMDVAYITPPMMMMKAAKFIAIDDFVMVDFVFFIVSF